MIDNLGFHNHPDYTTELATTQAEIRSLTGQITIGNFHSWEARHNTHGRLSTLLTREAVLTREAAMETQRLNRLADAARTVGNIYLAVIAYIVFGPAALPVEPLYEVRLIDPDGYTVPGTIRTNLPAARVEKTKTRLMTEDGPLYARRTGRDWEPGYRVQVTPF